ncbi:MAG: PLP-dependent aminotransferase family protein [Desulfobacterales bacterium]
MTDHGPRGPGEGPSKDRFRYRRLAADLEQRIRRGDFRPGDRLPSIRRLHRATGLSISTVCRAFAELEECGLVEAHPRSGHRVRPAAWPPPHPPIHRRSEPAPQRIRLAPELSSVIAATSDPDFVPLGNTGMDAGHVPAKAFARMVREINRFEWRSLLGYGPPEGSPELRRQIALRDVGLPGQFSAEEIVVTTGCTEAIALALQAVAQPGDTIAVESPTNFAVLQLLKERGMLAAEVVVDPREGVDLDDLARCLARHPVRACFLMPHFQNPTGALMPVEKKGRLLEILSRRGVPAVVDDISAPLHFTGRRPLPLSAWDREGLLIQCSSFSKTLAPGLRIGWVAARGERLERIRRLKAATSICTSSLDQAIVARFLASGAYDRHLLRLRVAFERQLSQTADLVRRHFPEGTRFAPPQGGTLLWVELPRGIDGLELYRRARARQIAIVPGAICANSPRFRNFVLISCAGAVDERVAAAIALLGRIACALQDERP